METPSDFIPVIKAEDVATRGEFVVDLLSALLQRILIVCACLFFLKFDLHTFVLMRGGKEVLDLAYILAGSDNLGMRPPMISVGYPLLLSPLLTSFVPTVAVYFVQIVSLLSLVICGRLLFRDEWLNRYWILGVPSFVFLTAMNTSESVFFLACFAALLCLNVGKNFVGGLLLGIALFILPHQTLLLILATLAVQGWKGKWESFQTTLIVVVAMIVVLLISNKANFGGYFMNARAVPHGDYTRYVFTPPFKYLLKSFLSAAVPLWKKIYVLANLVVITGGLGFMYIRIKENKKAFTDTVLWAWGCLSLLYVLCYGSEWALRSFSLIALPVFPAVLLGLERFLPKSWKGVVPLALLCIILAVLAEAF